MSFLKKSGASRFLFLLMISQAVVVLFTCSAFVRCETKTENQRIELWLDSTVPCLLKKYNVPGATIAIIRDGELAYSKGWGVQRVGEGIQINAQTIFPAASLTKPVFAYGALLLVRDGRLDLDRSLSDYLDEPYIQGDDRIHKITARMVLSHTTGFPNWRPGRWAGFPQPLEIHFEPGTDFRYSGEGYNYLQLVVENIAGQQLDTYMKDAVLDPLSMHDSYFVWNEALESVVASPHNRWGRAANKRQFRPEKPMAAATLFTTVLDYARFMSAMLSTTGPSDSESIQKLSADDLEKMLQPQIEMDNQLAWSLGWGLKKHESEWYFWQWGDNPGFKHFAVGSRSQKFSVVIFTNGQNGKNVYQEIIEVLLGVKLYD